MALPAVPAAPAFSKATNGDGTLFYVKVSGSAWQAVAELDDEDGLTDLPSGTQSLYETTHMGSGGYKEFKKHFRREGAETTITGNFVLDATAGSTMSILDGANDATDPIPYLVVLKQGAETWYMTGYALFYDLARTNPGSDVRQFSITAKWVGSATVTKESTT